MEPPPNERQCELGIAAHNTGALSRTPRVLSVQSTVVNGYVGNKCACFPLQLLGVDVHPMNTVDLSNHSGYAVVGGASFDGAHFEDLFEKLAVNQLDNYDYINTGYMGKPDSVQIFAKHIARLKAKNHLLEYYLDPVLGDNGKLYLPKEFIGLYKTHLLPLASVVLPNQFELEQLTGGARIKTISSALEAAAKLQIPNVVVTSFVASASSLVAPGPVEDTNLATQLLLVYCTQCNQPETRPRAWRVTYPQINGHFVGTGDLFCALLLAGRALLEPGRVYYGETLVRACAQAIWVMQKVLQRTVEEGGAAGSHTGCAPELAMVRSRNDILRLLQVTETDFETASIVISEIL